MRKMLYVHTKTFFVAVFVSLASTILTDSTTHAQSYTSESPPEPDVTPVQYTHLDDELLGYVSYPPNMDEEDGQVPALIFIP